VEPKTPRKTLYCVLPDMTEEKCSTLRLASVFGLLESAWKYLMIAILLELAAK